MKHPTAVSCLTLAAVIACSSCGKDPKLVAKSEQQKVEISRLKGELALVEERIKNMPPDVTEDLKKARKRSEEQAAEITRLEAEVADLGTRKRTLQHDFDSYRAKYQVK